MLLFYQNFQSSFLYIPSSFVQKWLNSACSHKLILFEVTFIQVFMLIKLHFSVGPLWMGSHDVKALQCDRCQSPDGWKCADCLNLPPKMYKHLMSDSGCSFCWFCAKCENIVIESDEGEDKGSMVNQSNSRIGNLVAVVEKLIEKLSVCQKQMNEIYNIHLVSTIESRLHSLEERFHSRVRMRHRDRDHSPAPL